MKRVILACLVATSVTGCVPRFYPIPVKNDKLAGVLPLVDGRVQYQFSENVPGVPAKEIFSRLRRWMALHVKNPGVMVAQSDHNNLELIVPVELESTLTNVAKDKNFVIYAMPSEFALIVRAKDGGFDATLGNFRKVNDVVHEIFYGKATTRPIEGPTSVNSNDYKEDFRRMDEQVRELVDRLRTVASREN